MTEGITEMEPSQRRLLPFVYDHLPVRSKWSPNRYVRVEMRDHGWLEVAAGRGTQRPQVIYVKTSILRQGRNWGGTGGLCRAPYHTKGAADFVTVFLRRAWGENARGVFAMTALS